MRREDRIERLNSFIFKKAEEYMKYCKSENIPAREWVRFGPATRLPENGKIVAVDSIFNISSENIVNLTDKLFVISVDKIDKLIAGFIIKLILTCSSPITINGKTIYDYIVVTDTVMDVDKIPQIMLADIVKYFGNKNLGIKPDNSITSLVFDIVQNYIMLIVGITDEAIKLSLWQHVRLMLFK